MELYRPVHTNHLNQGFGLANTAPSMLPFYKELGLNGHNGLDLATYHGEPIYFNVNSKGTVWKTEVDNKGGLGVYILTSEAGKYYINIYWHLMNFSCRAGQILKAGDLIGRADNTGMSTGDHLHYGLKEVKMDSNGNPITLNKDNGMLGAISPEPYWKNISIKDLVDNLTQQISLYQKVIGFLRQLMQKL
jgi:murein DD-endopeptidase MepM/ murein hydrolase activator NlpD